MRISISSSSSIITIFRLYWLINLSILLSSYSSSTFIYFSSFRKRCFSLSRSRSLSLRYYFYCTIKSNVPFSVSGGALAPISAGTYVLIRQQLFSLLFISLFILDVIFFITLAFDLLRLSWPHSAIWWCVHWLFWEYLRFFAYIFCHLWDGNFQECHTIWLHSFQELVLR